MDRTSQKLNIQYNFVRFIAITLVVVYHFHSSCLENANLPFAQVVDAVLSGTSFGGAGGVGTGLFYILSGAVLWNNYRSVFSTNSFYRKRALRLLIPQWIGFITSFLIEWTRNSSIFQIYSPAGIIISFMGLNYSGLCWEPLGIITPWLIGEWFTAVIILIYILFPLLRYLFRNHRLAATLIITSLFTTNLQLQFLSYYDGWFSITNGIMYFWLGMLFDEYKNYLQKWSLLVNALLILLILIWNPSKILGITYLPLFVIIINLFPLIYRIGITGKLIDFISKYSYDIYLTHHRVFLLILPVFLSTASSGLLATMAFFILIGLTVLLSVTLHRVSKQAESILNSVDFRLKA